MACHSRGEYGGALSPDIPHSTKLHCFDSIAEWRSREHLEPSLPSTAPAYWDSDDEENCNSSSIIGPRPSDLYGKFTWKIENFSEISKRELQAMSLKWVATSDYDKLLPGWSHFAQFTIAVVNKDPKKSKYSDTLHRFCKKEHDWGWKKFMELSKVLDGFTVADTLVIKAQVQVIRENAHRPFRCLDCQYRRELVRVYLTNVEGICRRFVEEKREKLGKLMEDTSRWASFRTFWSAVEEGARYRLAREKTDVILKAVVKRFFNEKEVTSTLVMDALYSGCKALDYRSRNKKGKINGVDMEEANPVVWVDKDVFVLAGDVLVLLERSVTESLPPCKDDKGPQNRTKDVGSGDDSGKDSVERDEHRLTELGRRTVEMFVLAYLYTNHVEVAYREAVALKRQEELIREEEAAGLAEMEMRVKREAAEKEKRLKKKQAKQRRKDRKEKDKEAEEKKVQVEQERHEFQGLLSKTVPTDPLHNECNIFSPPASLETCEDDGDLSGLDPTDDVGTLGPGTEDGDMDHTGWERGSSYAHNGMEAGCSGALLEETARNSRNTRKAQATLDDSSSTCSSDSLPQTGPNLNEAFATRPGLLEQSHVLPGSEENQVDSEIFDMDQQCIEAENMLRVTGVDVNGTCEPSSSSCSVEVDSETVILSLRDRVRWLEQRLFEKEEEVVMLQEQLSLFQLQMGRDRPSRLLVEEAANLPCRIQSHDVASVDLGRGETSTSLIQSPGGEGFDWGKTNALAGSGRGDGHSGFPNENGALLKVPFLSGLGGNNIRSNGYMPTLAKPDTMRMTNTTSRSRSVDSSRPPRMLTTPISGFTMAMSGSISGDEDTSLTNSLPSTSAGIGLSISRPSSAPSSVTGACANIPLFSSSVHPSQPLARSMSVGAGRPFAGTEPIVGAYVTIQSPPVTPSYKNATIGKTRTSSTAAMAPLCFPVYPNVSVGFSGPTSCVKTSLHMNNSCYSQAMAVPTTSVPSSSPLSTPSSQMGAFSGRSLPVISNSMEGGSLFIPPVVSSAAGGLRTPSSVVETLVPCHFLSENSGVGSVTNGHPSVDITFGTVTLELLQDDSVEVQPLLDQPHHEHDQKQRHSKHQLQQPGSHSNIVRFTTAQQQVLHQHHLQGPSAKMNKGPGLSIIRLATRSVTSAEHVNSGAVMSEEFPHLDIINNLLDEDQTNQILQHKGSSGYNLNYSQVPSRPSSLDGHNHNFCQAPSQRANDVPGGDRVDRIRAAENGEEQTSNELRDCVLMNAPFQHPPLAHLHNQQSLDGVSSHFWPVGNGTITSGNNNNKGLNGLVDSHLVYSLVQGHHLTVPDSSIFALGHNGYKVYTPAPQQP